MNTKTFPDMVVYSAPTTPIDAHDQFDPGAFREHLTWLKQAGLDGAIVCGSTGEFAALDDSERIAAFEVALDVFGPQGTIAHIGAATLRSALRILDAARAIGVQRVAAITPYYQPSGPASVREYYARLAERLGGDVFAYLFESRTATVVTPEQLADIAREAPLRGVKVSGEPAATVLAFKAAFPEGGQVLSGNDATIEEVILNGVDGAVAGISSAFPTPFVILRDALRRGDLEAAHAAQLVINQAIDATNGNPRLLKLALDLRGMRGGATRSALDEPTPQQVAALRAAVTAIP